MKTLCGVIVACGLLVSTAFAQPERAPRTLSAAERTAVLDAIKAKFQELYVFEDKRAPIVDRLNQAQKSGRYDVDDAITFGDRVTEDLVDVSHDKHLFVRIDPVLYAALSEPKKSSGESDDESEAYWRRRAIREHHGLTEMRRLPGNIRYLKISGFHWVSDETGAAYDDAVRFLKGGDAIIIDLRGNPGGSHPAVQYLVSHFLDDETLEMTFLEAGKPPVQSRALAHLPAGRLKGKPLYVLIDGGVGSAAEAFAYDVQQFKLGELVGTRTGGAANNNRFVPIAPAFVLSISFGRPVHAVSGSNWEGAGVAPTVDASSAQALDVAQALALERLSKPAPASAGAAGAATAKPDASVSPQLLAEYAWARTAVEARLHPVSVTPAQLEPLAGRFGTIDVSLRDGVLWLARPNRPVARLIPLNTDGLFAIEGSETLRARLTGKALELLAVDVPEPRVFPRS